MPNGTKHGELTIIYYDTREYSLSGGVLGNLKSDIKWI